MSNFNLLKEAIQKQFQVMIKEGNPLFITNVNVDDTWNTYLDAYPEGTNEIVKERREFDCQCCKQFIRNIGNVVVLKDNELVSIWDIDVAAPFKGVAKKMARFVKTANIKDAFFYREGTVGMDHNHKESDSGSVIKYEHFHLTLPSSMVKRDGDSIATAKGSIRTSKETFKRALDTLEVHAADTILELIAQGSLYRGAEFKGIIELFLKNKISYLNDIPLGQQDNWCWVNSVNSPVSRMRNSAIGTLMVNLSEGKELDEAVTMFESVVAPTNYKRPKAIFTKRMIEEAEKTLTDLGYVESLGRKHAIMDDITVNNVMFINWFSKKTGVNVFDDLASEVPESTKNLSKITEIGIDDFIKDVLPTTKSIQLLMENKNQGNLMSLIAPQDTSAASMFKWDNNFSWSYNGDIADSMKQHVKAAGGKVDGILRFSIMWNDGDNNQNDFDAHCIEPKGNTIYYSNMTNASTSGKLDVDVTRPRNKIAVENITWTNKAKMQEGTYEFLVHNYHHAGGTTGFTAEIEYEGDIYSYSYDKELKRGEKVPVATLTFSKTDGIKFISSMDSQLTQKEVWGIKTNSFVEVSSMMRSPNYWDDQHPNGNQHYFFFLNGCINNNNPRGFYNEFLKESLLTHKNVFEALGSKMRVEHSNDQLSGLGFSTTQRNSVIAKVEGSFNRPIQINF